MTPANPSPLPAMVACGFTLGGLLLTLLPVPPKPPITLPTKSGWTQTLAPERWEYRQHQTVVTLTYVPHSDGDALAQLGPTGDRRLTAVGEIGYVVQEDALLATTCISPRGQGSASRDRMRQNRNRYDLTPGRIGGWLLGRHNLRDWRCLILTVRLPVADGRRLETLLPEWYTWGQQHFEP
ncbi:MAG: hypothetical protein HC918_14105 [Oscillatoriales cyanobacterium SM2_1_8]|nr:hypothetical protein [Oscillatoriales cyanobacterium SM2_1_8]